jgi:hypothetical protein
VATLNLLVVRSEVFVCSGFDPDFEGTNSLISWELVFFVTVVCFVRSTLCDELVTRS